MESALKPPSGVTSNFEHPVSLRRWDILAVSLALSITTVVYGLRNYVRAWLKRQWGLEDWICMLSWIGLVTYCALMTTTMSRHGGIHGWDLTRPQVREAMYWFNLTSVVYGSAILFPKLAVLLLFRRIFVPTRGTTWDISLRIFMAILIMFYTAITLVKIWECEPRARIWNKSLPGKCINIPALLITSGLFNTITDIIVLLIPVKSVWNLQMSSKRKVAIIAVFTVGSTAPVFSIIGFVVRTRVSANPDTTYNQPEILLWATAEISSCLICACLPTLAALKHKRTCSSKTRGSTLQIDQKSARLYSLKRPASTDEEDLFNTHTLGMGYRPKQHLTGHHTRGRSTTVVTGIEGGIHLGSMSGDANLSQLDLSGTTAEAGTRPAIVQTLRIEHSYV